MAEKKITLEVELPYEFRIVRYGDSDNLELESFDKMYDIKTKKYKNEKAWRFCGYYASIQAALKGYIKDCPRKRLRGKVNLQETIEFLKEIERIAYSVSRGKR